LPKIDEGDDDSQGMVDNTVENMVENMVDKPSTTDKLSTIGKLSTTDKLSTTGNEFPWNAVLIKKDALSSFGPQGTVVKGLQGMLLKISVVTPMAVFGVDAENSLVVCSLMQRRRILSASVLNRLTGNAEAVAAESQPTPATRVVLPAGAGTVQSIASYGENVFAWTDKGKAYQIVLDGTGATVVTPFTLPGEKEITNVIPGGTFCVVFVRKDDTNAIYVVGKYLSGYFTGHNTLLLTPLFALYRSREQISCSVYDQISCSAYD
jgi:hypothetical protein